MNSDQNMKTCDDFHCKSDNKTIPKTGLTEFRMMKGYSTTQANNKKGCIGVSKVYHKFVRF